ncbi:MAG: MotA/TolQ/ExbB proton channel family protein [candidate division KSB1 bacterium]|nr:MotA/TolQ/ExbB proton channel family protein [candidate division KSB1 bacterium]MDZ7305152.1 MotA/TolQ/ExbB proton channel family protein [candidate division KSB1 bacterium]MDZ7314236.1 MotA/TolQ/ExbB proton channel family protein [candidate division KSB1 bacterium]
MFHWRTTSVVLLGMLLLLVATTGPAFAVQNTSTPSAQQTSGATALTSGTPTATSQRATTKADTVKGGMAKNFAQWTRQGGVIMYPIYLVFIIGLGVLVYQMVRIVFDKKRMKPIRANIERSLSPQQEEFDRKSAVLGIWKIVAEYPQSLMAQLFEKLCGLWHRDPSAESLQTEIQGYMETTKERYELLRSFTVLLSDTAGALGLLGTVWGMYITFMPGKLESSQVILGMGTALVTTIGGLVVSILLNFGIAFVHNTFLTHLGYIEEQADKFRYIFGKGQSVAVDTSAILSSLTSVAGQVARPPVPEPRPELSRPVPTTMKILSGNHQIAEAGSELPKPLEIAVLDQYGKPMENLPVIFETDGTMISLEDGDNIKRVETDFAGRARTHARLGKLVGKHTIVARVDGGANLEQEFEIESRPGAPDKLYVLSGHLQTGRPGATLPDPLSLKLEDAYGNPVPEQSVVFEVTYNNGRLDHDKTRTEVYTDEDGIASVGFRLAETPGANIVKAAVKSKTTRKLETSFESMGRE